MNGRTKQCLRCGCEMADSTWHVDYVAGSFCENCEWLARDEREGIKTGWIMVVGIMALGLLAFCVGAFEVGTDAD